MADASIPSNIWVVAPEMVALEELVHFLSVSVFLTACTRLDEVRMLPFVALLVESTVYPFATVAADAFV